VSSSTVASEGPERTSLYVSLPSFLGPVVPLLFVLVFAIYLRNAYIWSAFAVAWGFSVFWWIFVGTRRIDLDAEGLTLIPFVPLRRRQRFRWSEVGTFEQLTGWKYSRSPRGILQASIIGARPVSAMGGLYRSWTLKLPAWLAPSPTAPALGADALRALLNSYPR